MRPPLDAGSGAPFFLLLIATFQSLNFDINTLFLWQNLEVTTKKRYFETIFYLNLVAIPSWLLSN
jgi:hypothetical protein